MTTTSHDGFSESMVAIESILEKFRQGTPKLEEALTWFEQGIHHLKTCQSELSQAKGRVEELVGSLDNIDTLQVATFETALDDDE